MSHNQITCQPLFAFSCCLLKRPLSHFAFLSSCVQIVTPSGRPQEVLYTLSV